MLDVSSPDAFMSQLQEMEAQTHTQQEQLEQLRATLERKQAEAKELQKTIHRFTTQQSAHEAHITQLCESLTLMDEKAGALRYRLSELDDTVGLVDKVQLAHIVNHSSSSPSSLSHLPAVAPLSPRNGDDGDDDDVDQQQRQRQRELVRQKADSLLTVFFTLQGAYHHRNAQKQAIGALLECWDNRNLLGGGLLLKNVFPLDIASDVDEAENVRKQRLYRHFVAMPPEVLSCTVQLALECVAEEAARLGNVFVQ